MDSGYFLAEKRPDGTPGRPIGGPELGAILMFDDFDVARNARGSSEELSLLSIFKVNIAVVGEVS